MLLLLLACTQSEKTNGQDQDTSTVVETGPNFENEAHLRVFDLQEEPDAFSKTGMGLIEAYFVNLTPPTYPYEVQSVTYQLRNIPNSDCGTGGSLNIIAHASNVPPSENPEIVDFIQYDSLSPYIFPTVENTASAVVVLDSTSNPETIVDNVFEFTAVFDPPLLIEDDLDLWLGYGIHDIPSDQFTCTVVVQGSGVITYYANGGQMDLDDLYAPNLGVNVRY